MLIHYSMKVWPQPNHKVQIVVGPLCFEVSIPVGAGKRRVPVV